MHNTLKDPPRHMTLHTRYHFGQDAVLPAAWMPQPPRTLLVACIPDVLLLPRFLFASARCVVAVITASSWKPVHNHPPDARQTAPGSIHSSVKLRQQPCSVIRSAAGCDQCPT
jgi:hypothetical protein